VGARAIEQREHLGVHDAAPGGEPLHVAAAEPRRSAQRIAVIDQPAPRDGHGLEAAMRMAGEAGDDVAVIHAPAVLAGEALADVAAGERRRRPQLIVARRVGVVVMDAEQEGVLGVPGEAQLEGLADWLGHATMLSMASPAASATIGQAIRAALAASV